MIIYNILLAFQALVAVNIGQQQMFGTKEGSHNAQT